MRIDLELVDKMLYKKTTGLVQEEKGATSIEYALLASIIAVAIVIFVEAVGVQVQAFYQSVADAFP